MSDQLKVAFVVEGKTDFFILKKVIEKFLDGRDFDAQCIHPEESQAFLIGGWAGVCRWCQGSGRLIDTPYFVHDILILQLDADVAGNSYSDGHITDPFPESTLPCEEPCPPASATTNRLRNVALRWMGETDDRGISSKVVFCIPSKALETWILVGLFPEDRIANLPTLECRDNPESTLQSKPLDRRLVRSGRKIPEKYEELAPEFANNWNTVKARCGEAERFETEFLDALAQDQ